MTEVPEHPYDRHVGRYGAELAAHLIEFAGIAPGDRVLDVGCGTGRLTVALAERVGAERVAAIDPSAEAVAVCRARVPSADVRCGSAEDLPFADRALDAALAQLVVNLVDDPPAAVSEMVRVVKPGGVVAACFWDDREMPLLRSYWDAVAAVAPGKLAGIEARARVGVADLEQLRRWWEDAGLREVDLGAFEVSADYESFEDLFHPFEAGVGHSGGLYAALESGTRAAIREEARRALGSPAGAFTLTAKVRAVRGIRAGAETG